MKNKLFLIPFLLVSINASADKISYSSYVNSYKKALSDLCVPKPRATGSYIPATVGTNEAGVWAYGVTNFTICKTAFEAKPNSEMSSCLCGDKKEMHKNDQGQVRADDGDNISKRNLLYYDDDRRHCRLSCQPGYHIIRWPKRPNPPSAPESIDSINCPAGMFKYKVKK